jgi:hypothetical protein
MRNTFWLRACLVHPRTSETDIRALIEIVKTEFRALSPEL